MLIIPAIDIQDGYAVRLVQGKFNKKVYSSDPVKMAKHWIKQGAKYLHIVDLDGAFTGSPKNLDIVRIIAKETKVKIEFGGGLRTISAIKAVLSLGVNRVIIGTKAVEDKAFLKKALKLFKDKVIVGVDAKNGQVMVKGWKSTKGTDVFELCSYLKSLGIKEIIYTDTLKDGTLTGPNISNIKNMLKVTGLKIIASGGISSLLDLKKLKALEKKGISGVIIGKALYEGRFTLAEALKYS